MNHRPSFLSPLKRSSSFLNIPDLLVDETGSDPPSKKPTVLPTPCKLFPTTPDNGDVLMEDVGPEPEPALIPITPPRQTQTPLRIVIPTFHREKGSVDPDWKPTDRVTLVYKGSKEEKVLECMESYLLLQDQGGLALKTLRYVDEESEDGDESLGSDDTYVYSHNASPELVAIVSTEEYQKIVDHCLKGRIREYLLANGNDLDQEIVSPSPPPEKGCLSKKPFSPDLLQVPPAPKAKDRTSFCFCELCLKLDPRRFLCNCQKKQKKERLPDTQECQEVPHTNE